MPEGSYEPDIVEEKWQEIWVEEGTYAYEGADDHSEVFSVDTPPPTVSGDLHMGHLYGFTLQDFVARFRRMHEGAVYFPFGYDDNGIASERLTEDELGIRHQDFSRREFQEKCREVCQEYEDDFTEKMQALAFSMDWDHTYKTIEPRVQRISQLSFIDLYEQGREYRKKAPAIWCPECETAISQVEMEDAERHSHFNDIRFPIVGEDDSVTISTTRPELLPACVAVFVHPDDPRSDELAGKKARVPLFGQEVEILEDDRVDMETGSGVVMSCTFGDQTDIEWYNAHDLDLRIAIDESGTMTEEAGEYAGLSTKEARKRIAEDLDTEGYLIDREPIEHTVQVHERCEEDIEFLVTEQWYVKLLDKKERYLEAGREMDWYPEKMFTRYEHWIEGLQWDWCISRQRDSGIPFPVWYCADCGQEILAERDDLPVDPLQDDPPVDRCPECGGTEFEPEEDVFDTWATSSLTPLINAGWDWNGQEFTMEHPELYPMNLRPQGHDIISFWLFHTVVKCLEHTGEVPFESVSINGMVLDENAEKMSKSKGNVVLPDEVLEQFPVDATRYWAAGTSIGDDFPFKEKDLVTGEKLMRKIWNASKLVEELTEPGEERPDRLDPIDEWLLAELDDLIEYMTAELEEYGFSKARNRLREFFWNTYCDNYLEIAKQRADSQSTRYALREAHRTFLKLFAPFLVHITEELWHEMYADGFSTEMASGEDADASSTGSIHLQDWPEPRGEHADLEAGERAMDVIHALRKYKSDHHLPPTADLATVEVYGDLGGFGDAVQGVMHVDHLVEADGTPEVDEQVDEIVLEYATVGPQYGEKVSEIEAALDEEDYELDGRVLRVAGEVLEPDEFEVRKERTFTGDGELVEAGDVLVVVRD